MKTAAYRYEATCHRVIDGDTYELSISLGFKATLIVPVRLRGVDCPEMGTPEGTAAKQFVEKLLWPDVLTGLRGNVQYGPAGGLIVETHKRPSGSDAQSFARYVADVWLEDGRRLADVLLKAGHAVPLVIP